MQILSFDFWEAEATKNAVQWAEDEPSDESCESSEKAVYDGITDSAEKSVVVVVIHVVSP